MRVLAMTLFLLVSAVGGTVHSKSEPYLNYNYDFWGKVVPAPQAYTVRTMITAASIGLSDFKEPQDVFVSDSSDIYIVDTGNNRVICLDSSFNLKSVITGFVSSSGQSQAFRSPSSVFVTQQGHIYIADTGNARIVQLDQSGNLVKVYGPPASTVEGVLSDDFAYIPIKIGVDPVGRIYVASKNTFDGLIQIGPDGDFLGFMGAPRVTPSVSDIFWHRLATQEQRERMALFLPTEYSSLDIDDSGFIYVTDVRVGNEEPVKRLNPSGQDVLLRRGFHSPRGDIRFPPDWNTDSSVKGPSSLVDVAAARSFYSVLDSKRGRVFTYDSTGNLLYVFGGVGNHRGAFISPVALDTIGDSIAVLDSHTGALTVFDPTEYAKSILAAIRLYESGLYQQSMEMWQLVLRLNANYDQAYIGIGRALLRQGKYKEAMDNFRLGNDRQGYSKAFSVYRKEMVSQWFSRVMLAVLVVACGIAILYRQYSKRSSHRRLSIGDSEKRNLLSRIFRSLLYPVDVALHPTSGFWSVKHEGQGNLVSAVLVLILVTATYIIMRQYTGFIFNARDLTQLNLAKEAASVLIPFGLWCTVNWALTTLMDGKGTVRDIFVASSFALTPIILVNIPATLLSNVITMQEGSFYYLLVVISGAWSFVLMFIGTMVIHEYDFRNNVLTLGLTVVGIGAVLFIGLLLYSVVDLMIGLVNDFYAEIVLRM